MYNNNSTGNFFDSHQEVAPQNPTTSGGHNNFNNLLLYQGTPHPPDNSATTIQQQLVNQALQNARFPAPLGGPPPLMQMEALKSHSNGGMHQKRHVSGDVVGSDANSSFKRVKGTANTSLPNLPPSPINSSHSRDQIPRQPPEFPDMDCHKGNDSFSVKNLLKPVRYDPNRNQNISSQSSITDMIPTTSPASSILQPDSMSDDSKAEKRKNVYRKPLKGTLEYRKKRDKNNEAVRKSRDKAKRRAEEISQQLLRLTHENDDLNKRLTDDKQAVVEFIRDLTQEFDKRGARETLYDIIGKHQLITEIINQKAKLVDAPSGPSKPEKSFVDKIDDPVALKMEAVDLGPLQRESAAREDGFSNNIIHDLQMPQNDSQLHLGHDLSAQRNGSRGNSLEGHTDWSSAFANF